MGGRGICLVLAAVLALASGPALGQGEPGVGSVSAPPTASDLRTQAYGLFAGTISDKSRAVDLFRQAAELGDADAMAFLGSIHLSGDGVERDRAAAIDWYLKAAQAGHAGAVAKLAELAASPEGQTTPVEPAPLSSSAVDEVPPSEPVIAENAIPPADLTRFEAALAKARAMREEDDLSPDKLRNIASLVAEGADANHPPSMLLLAETYFDIDHIVATRAVRLLNEYVELTGDPAGMERLARAMEFAEGTPLDLPGSLTWLAKAKAAGLTGVDGAIARVEKKLLLLPWPEVEVPPEDRWGQFRRDGFPAVGIRSGSGSAAFVCFQEGLMFEFVPDGPIDPQMEALGDVAVVYSENGRWALSAKRWVFNRLTITSATARDWLDAIAAASAFTIGLAANVSNDSEPDLFNVSEFTGRGSSAARDAIMAMCAV